MYVFPQIDITKTCCFTGPRPEKISSNEQDIRFFLRNSIIDCIQNGYVYFITGMSRGFDLWAAKEVLDLSKKYNISLICAIPFFDQDEKWSTLDRAIYNDILCKARYTICLSDNYIRGIYHERNRFMVDMSTTVITHYTNTGGGTKYTLDYATSFNKNIINIANPQIKLFT